MDDKRSVIANNVSVAGFLVCRCGRFAVFLTNAGDFKLVDEKENTVLDHLTEADAHDLCDTSRSVEEWSGHHHIVKR